VQPDPARLRLALADARIMLVFTPELAGADPYGALGAAIGHVDCVQVRPKPLGVARAVTPAREAFDASVRVLELVRASGLDVPVLVNDRVDVACALWPRGLAGVHLGQDDQPATDARRCLGNGPLLGLSTHNAEQVVLAEEKPVDYLGFGPVHSSTTKGYDRGIGAEIAWVASAAACCPLFAIGGIDSSNVHGLAEVGRVAVGAAILADKDPARAAQELRELLTRD